ncbi:MAG TPA: alpha/beta fold hydrolase [Ferruginibacter sp.]|nr:alpha/beta fold hydrolase [Ferruginibacter sp.]
MISQFATAQTEGFLSNEGSVIHYRTYGKGDPLLIINGGPGMNSNGFAALADSLSSDRMVILYDQRGTGQSTLPEISIKTISMKNMLNDIEVLRKALHINQWTILGHSFGGMLASYYASIYPERVNALILSSSGGIDLELLQYVNRNIQQRLSAKDRQSLEYWNNKIAEGDTSHAARLQRGMALAPAYLYHSQFIPQVAERLTQGNTLINNLLWDDMRTIHFNCADSLASFNKPVLIIQGKQDIIEEKTARKAQSNFKKSQVVILDKCGHYGWLDSPTLYFKSIRTFLSNIKN